MLSSNEKKRIDKKYFQNQHFKVSYFFEPLHMTTYGVRVLDVGCGSGQHLRFFSPSSVGLTYADDSVLAYVRDAYELDIRKFNIDEKWPYDLGEFDVIFSADSIIHISSPTKLLFEMRHRLKDDGKLLLMIPQSSPFFSADKSHLHHYTFNRRTMLHMLEMTGFDVELTSGFIRRLPDFVNKLLEPFTKRWGPNLWVIAHKNKNFKISKRNIRPKWIPEEVWE